MRLKLEVAAIHRESGGTYGSPRIYVEMVARGFGVGRHKVARLMREQGLAGAVQRRFRRPGQSKDGGPFAPDLVQRDFKPEAPNRTWVSDITYIRPALPEFEEISGIEAAVGGGEVQRLRPFSARARNWELGQGSSRSEGPLKLLKLNVVS